MQCILRLHVNLCLLFMSVINIKLATVVVFNLFSDMHQHTFLDQSPGDQITGSSCFEAKDFGNILGGGGREEVKGF